MGRIQIVRSAPGGGGGFDGTHTGSVDFANDNKLESGLVVRRIVASDSTSDADIFVVEYNGQRQAWTNEKGQWRVSNTESASDVALKLIVADGGAQALQVLKPDGTPLAEIAADGILSAPNLQGGIVVLGSADPVPPGTPAGTAIVRY